MASRKPSKSTRRVSPKDKIKESARKANAAAFQTRVQRKKTSQGLDVYDYGDEFDKKRMRLRTGVSMEVSKDTARELGHDDDGSEDEVDRIRAQLQVANDGVVRSEDDEDIDSDDAFDDADDEQFASHFTQHERSHKGSRKPEKVNAEVDLDEESDASSESEGEGNEEEEGPASVHGNMSQDDSDEEGVMVSEQLKPENDGLEWETGTESDDAALDALGTFIGKLDSGQESLKRKASEIEDVIPPTPTKRRRITQERNQAGVEGEFGAISSGAKLQLSDLLDPLAHADGSSGAVLSLGAAAKVLRSTKAAPLSAPLPLRTQDKLDRQAAYEQTKEELQKWNQTMKSIREAEHLSFPLQVPPKSKPSLAGIASDLKPTTEMESAVDKLLRTAKLREQDIAKTEELKMQDLSVEEVARRHVELRKMRELMFREEIKAKRVAKIKSKTYRKIQKRQKAKETEKLRDMQGDTNDADDRLKAAAERAKERATLKHKNTGKWAQSMLGRELDLDQRKQVQEMYQRGERLRRRIAGVDSGSDSEESDGDDEEGEVSSIKAHALEKLAQLEEDTEPPLLMSGHKGGVLDMKFMKDAMQRESLSTRAELDTFDYEMGRLESADGDLDLSNTDPHASRSRLNGRVQYNPGVVNRPQVLQMENVETASTLKSSPTVGSVHTLRDSPSTPLMSTPTAMENPWLKSKGTTKLSRSTNEVIVDKNSGSAALSKNALKKHLRKTELASAEAKDDALIALDSAAVLLAKRLSNGSGREQDKAGDKSTKSTAPTRLKSVTFQQRDLVAMAFAGDNVVAEFEEQKAREVNEDAPKSVDTTLPGWGSWGGEGITPRPPKPERIKHFPGITQAQRKDATKPHVIISERNDKKLDKYLVKDLPFPYTSKAQFERRLEAPIGMEWNTRKSFQRATLPKVVTKMSTIINPLEKRS